MSQTMEILLGEGKKIDALYERFTIRTDQSVKSGGGATAPEPFDLFLASIGTCAGNYVSAFCQTRGLPVDGIRLLQTWTRDDRGKLDGIQLRLHLPAGFPGKYRNALLRAMNQCSVKRVLESPPPIETTVITDE
jgi:ribosomal protein S12 methylthiotransferase accessory factor